MATSKKSRVPKPVVPTADRVADTRFLRTARPDAIDYRDRMFRPAVGRAPAPVLFPAKGLGVRHQGATNACTGFALSLVVEHLQRTAGREPDTAISPFMLYSMARRYDEYPGSTEDGGSSTRGALKGWFKHGACRDALFPGLDMPAASTSPVDDWWTEAVRRPLGAYYRIDPQAITDMHAALNEVGILFVSSGCHGGWDEGIDAPTRKRRPTSFKDVWEIPVRGDRAAHEAHSFAIVGYNERGFLIQNSWGTEWGSYGYALLTYADWLRNAMDCWVAQLGVVTQEHEEISTSVSLRTDPAGRVALAATTVLRHRELSPFIVNMAGTGVLSNSGVFRTKPDDLRALVDVHLAEARKRWKLKARDPVDVCVFAHGGLVGEAAAAEVAAKWVPLLYDHRIFPVFLMWEADFFTTALNCIDDAVKGVPRSLDGGLPVGRWWNERLERLLARPGTLIWNEMKQNAAALSAEKPGEPDERQAGCVLLWRHFRRAAEDRRVRLHLVGHSAGAVVASAMVPRLVEAGLSLQSLSLMAPAVTVRDFDAQVRPHLVSGKVDRYQQFHLTDRAEQDDHTCGPYRRSLLYLVSQAFEGGTPTPVLGMQKYFDAFAADLPRTTAWVAPGPVSASTSHGGFDDDPGTQQRVLDFMLGRA